ncbi:MAG: serine/threonine protein kinase, partial [Planctomyces sp.]|nr:serine/threonine protein kinase [Planctomyces sp.]
RFLSEARAVGRLNHPHVLTVHEVASSDGVDFLVMEYASGGSAADHLKNIGPYSPVKATLILEQACRGLTVAHQNGLIHRDIKPANLLVVGDDIVKVSDFGVVKFIGRDNLGMTQQGQLVGTPCYMSPEQCESRPVDERSDVYSLGATYFSLLVGRMPYEEEKTFVSVMHAHLNADPPDPRDWSDEIPEGCRQVILKAMAKRPEDRYQSAEEMRNALALLLSEMTLPAGMVAGDAPQLGASIQLAPGIQLKSSQKMIKWVIGGVLAAVFLLFAFLPINFDKSQTGETEEEKILPAATEQEPIRIGILHSLTGSLAISEEVIVDSYELAIAEINRNGGVLGRPVKAVIRDGQSKDAVFAAQATELIDVDKVCTIFGCCTSASRKAVKEVVEAKHHLLVYSVNTEGVEMSPNIIYLGGDPQQTIIPFLNWAYSWGKKRTFFLVGSDYIFPHVVNDIAKKELEFLGAELVGEEYLSLEASDVSDVVEKIEAAKPDAIINMITGDSQTIFLRELDRRNIETTQFATGIGEEVLRRIDHNPLIENYSCCTYFQSIPTEANQKFVHDFREMHGEYRVLMSSMEAGYVAVHLWAAAVNELGTLDPIRIREAMLKQTVAGPSGKVSIDPESQYSIRNGFIGKATPSDQFEIVWQSPEPIRPEPFPDYRTETEWNEFLDEHYRAWGNSWTAPVE